MIQYRVGDLTPPSEQGNRYRLGEELGGGQNGAGYRSRGVFDDEMLNVAVKIPKGDPDEAAIQLRHEANLMRHAGCSQIVDLYDASFDESHPYLVTEYVPHTLYELMLSGRMNQSIIRTLVTQTPDLLNMMRRRNVVHLDLKLDNLGLGSYFPGEKPDLMDPKSQVLVAFDFGLAVSLGKMGKRYIAHAGTRELNPQYPPEFLESKEVNATTDTHIMGRVLGWCIAGTDANSLADVVRQAIAIHGRAPPPSFLQLYNSLTQRDPAQRPDPQKLADLARKVVDDLDAHQYFFPQGMEIDVQRSSTGRLTNDEPTSSMLNRISLESL